MERFATIRRGAADNAALESLYGRPDMTGWTLYTSPWHLQPRHAYRAIRGRRRFRPGKARLRRPPARTDPRSATAACRWPNVHFRGGPQPRFFGPESFLTSVSKDDRHDA